MIASDLMLYDWVNRMFYNPNPNNPAWEMEKCEVVGVRTNSLIVRLKGGFHTVIDYCEGIPLTEEILLKCGFVKLKETEYTIDTYQLYGINIWVKNNQFLLLDRFVINYLHELQQVVRLLTKRELEIEL